jgi:hypothetical protein
MGVPATHPWSVGPPRTLYNRQCAGGWNTPGHDGERIRLYPGLILMHIGSGPAMMGWGKSVAPNRLILKDMGPRPAIARRTRQPNGKVS